MAIRVLFVQGGGEGAHDEWDAKLVESLERQLGRDYQIRYPRMPDEADPHYARWKAALDRELESLDGGAMLVGHSIGGTMCVNALGRSPPGRGAGRFFLGAAPFQGGGWGPRRQQKADDAYRREAA